MYEACKKYKTQQNHLYSLIFLRTWKLSMGGGWGGMCVFYFFPGFKGEIFCIKLPIHTVKPQQSCTYKGKLLCNNLFEYGNEVRTAAKQLSVSLRPVSQAPACVANVFRVAEFTPNSADRKRDSRGGQKLMAWRCRPEVIKTDFITSRHICSALDASSDAEILLSCQVSPMATELFFQYLKRVWPFVLTMLFSVYTLSTV